MFVLISSLLVRSPCIQIHYYHISSFGHTNSPNVDQLRIIPEAMFSQRIALSHRTRIKKLCIEYHLSRVFSSRQQKV